MLKIAELVMKGRKQAILTAMLFTFIPFFGWVSDVITDVITLRNGAKEGAIILMWVILPPTVLGMLGYHALWLYSVLFGSIVAYGFALILRHTRSWSAVLQWGMVVGLLMVTLIHLFFPSILSHMSQDLARFVVALKDRTAIDITPEEATSLINTLVKIGIGLQVVLVWVGDLFSVLMARWWQALLFNPQGLSAELTGIRMGLLPIVLFVLVFLGAVAGFPTAEDSMPVVLFPFLLSGISLVHYGIKEKGSSAWLLIFYSALVLLFPYVVGMLVVIALLDYWFDFRGRLKILH